MGVLGPLEEAIDKDVPATPPDLQDLQVEDNSEDDLFADTVDRKEPGVFIYNNDFSFKHIIPILPSKGEYEDNLGMETQNYSWGVQQSPPSQKRRNFCFKCFEEVKRDLKKLAKVIENYKNERDAARAENESLKKEVEELKKILKQKEEEKQVSLKVSIDNLSKDHVDVSLKRKNFKNTRHFSGKDATKQEMGINLFSISLSEQHVYTQPIALKEGLENEVQPNAKKTVAELRRDFFAEEFKSEQKTFTAHSFLEIKPEERKETAKSQMTIKIKPKEKFAELISKLTSKFGRPKVIPEMPPITMFQSFQKTKEIWSIDREEKVAFKM